MVQQQASKQQVGLNYHISGTPIAQGPKLRPNGPLPKAIVPTKFGPPTPGWRRSTVVFLWKMAQTEGMQCGPATGNSKQQQVGLNYDISGTPIAQRPKLRPKGPLPRALVPTKFGPPTPGWRLSAAILLVKNGQNGPLEAEMGQKGVKTAPTPRAPRP